MSPSPKVTARISLTDSDSPISHKGVRGSLNRIPNLNSDPPSSPFGPGQYAIAVEPRSLPPGCFVQAVQIDGKDLPTPEFQNPHLHPHRHRPQPLRRNHHITSVVSDFPGAIVTLIPSDPTAPPVKQIAGDDGQFTFTNLRPGEYRLYAWDQVDDDLWPDPDFRKRYDSTTVEITVAPRSTVNSKLRVNQSPED